MWSVYRVRWEGLTQLCGSVPADPEIVKAWLDARKPTVRAPGSRSIDEVNEEVLATIERGDVFDEKECNILVFQRNNGILCQRAATIKAHLKDCSRRLSTLVGRVEKEKAFSTKVINYVYPDERQYWVPILRPDGTPVTKHDGERDKAIHPRPGVSALKRFEWVDPWVIEFDLKVVEVVEGKPAVSEDDLHKLMIYGGTHGYAGERGDGEGRYTYRIERLRWDGIAAARRSAATPQRGGAVPEARATARRPRT